MNKETSIKAATSRESWRAALIAFWKADGSFQRAENLSRGEPMDWIDRRTVEALILAGERAPRKAA